MTKINLKSAPIHASPCSVSKRCVSLARLAHRGVLPPLPGLVGLPAVTGAGTALGRDCVSANQYHFTKMGCDVHCQGVGTTSSAEQTGHHRTETRGRGAVPPDLRAGTCGSEATPGLLLLLPQEKRGDTNSKKRGTKSICSGCQWDTGPNLYQYSLNVNQNISVKVGNNTY